MTFENLVKSIDSLPPLSNATLLIQQLYSNGAEHVEIKKLVKIIESDALLAANILKMINAPYYGFSKQILSISQAVSLFGTQKIYGLILHYSINEKIKANTKVYGISPSIFNVVCHIQSSLMMHWYSKIDNKDAKFLTPLALIMESGKLIVAREVDKSDYIEEFSQGYKNCIDTDLYEDEYLNTTSYYLSGLLFEHWNLEPSYVNILKNLDYDNNNISLKTKKHIDVLDIVRTAVNTREILTKKSVLKACKLIRNMNLNVDVFVKIALILKKNYVKNLRK